jgi:signal transduction histidine kinase
MGIGLTIRQSIVAAHGGTITAMSPPGGGAQFRVVLPATSSDPKT